METILIEALAFVCGSAAGGLTWDLMKEAGSKLLASFKKHFVNTKFFIDESQAEAFIKDISTKEALNKRHPLEDIWTVYDNCTGQEAPDSFKTEFIDWIKANEEAIKHLGEGTVQGKGIFIQKQVNKGHAQVTNIGNQYNYRGIDENGEQTDK